MIALMLFWLWHSSNAIFVQAWFYDLCLLWVFTIRRRIDFIAGKIVRHNALRSTLHICTHRHNIYCTTSSVLVL
jgi:hypothetical protein